MDTKSFSGIVELVLCNEWEIGMNIILYPLVVGLSLSVCAVRVMHRGDEAYRARLAYCDAEEAFTRWRMKKPEMHLAYPEEGVKIFSELIDAYDWFLSTHPYHRDGGHRAWLMNLFEVLKAVCLYFDASIQFAEWKMKNPGVYLGLSDEGKRKLSHVIEAYDRVLETHPHHKDEGHRAWLMSLFDDFPPNSPSERPVEHPQEGCFFSLVRMCLGVRLEIRFVSYRI
jgi:hypothetical protein